MNEKEWEKKRKKEKNMKKGSRRKEGRQGREKLREKRGGIRNRTMTWEKGTKEEKKIRPIR